MRKLSDFGLNTQVIYLYEDGRIDLGSVQGWYGENIRVQWSIDDEGNLADCHFTNPRIVLVSSLLSKVGSKLEIQLEIALLKRIDSLI